MLVLPSLPVQAEDGLFFLDHFARTDRTAVRRPKWRWNLGRKGAAEQRNREGHRIHSVPFQRSFMWEWEAQSATADGRTNERTPKCMPGGVNFHFHSLRCRSFGAERRGIGQNDSYFGLCPTPQLGMPKVEKDENSHRERSCAITNVSSSDTTQIRWRRRGTRFFVLGYPMEGGRTI